MISEPNEMRLPLFLFQIETSEAKLVHDVPIVSVSVA